MTLCVLFLADSCLNSFFGGKEENEKFIAKEVKEWFKTRNQTRKRWTKLETPKKTV